MTEASPPAGGSWRQGGYEARYIVRRADGKPIRGDARYFVLQFNGEDPHATAALYAYAGSIFAENRQLAEDIFKALADPASAPPQH